MIDTVKYHRFDDNSSQRNICLETTEINNKGAQTFRSNVDGYKFLQDVREKKTKMNVNIITIVIITKQNNKVNQIFFFFFYYIVIFNGVYIHFLIICD